MIFDDERRTRQSIEKSIWKKVGLVLEDGKADVTIYRNVPLHDPQRILYEQARDTVLSELEFSGNTTVTTVREEIVNGILPHKVTEKVGRPSEWPTVEIKQVRRELCVGKHSGIVEEHISLKKA
jgi:hypothetical protein